jgi:queuine/archaeosine tRNA-ribosyltransferase
MLRPEYFHIGTTPIRLPVFFPSVSSVKTNLSPAEYVSVLCSLSKKQFLVSAYDLQNCRPDEQSEVSTKLAEAKANGSKVLMDSGNYESFWHRESDKWEPADFHKVLSTFECSFAFGFDEQIPPENRDDHLRNMHARYEKDQSIKDQVCIIPIVHGKPEDLPGLCSRLVEITSVNFVAVPERCLGDGIIARSLLVSAIREALNTTGRYIGLHLLGTGNPISIATYTRMGADSFDGLEWCQTCVDHETNLLFHFTQADFFMNQTDWVNLEVPFLAKTLAHNLEFYDKWMDELAASVHSNRLDEFCRNNFPNKIYEICKEKLGWLDD